MTIREEKGGAPKGGGPGWGPKPRKKCGGRERERRRVGARTVGPRRGGGQHFALFFPLPPPFSLFFLSLGVFSWNFGGV